MLKKMRWRFILSAMAAIVAVVLVLVVGMNLFNYHLAVQRQDQVLEQLMDRELGESGDQGPDDGPHGQRPDGKRPEGEEPPGEKSVPGQEATPVMPGPFGGHSPEFRYTLRYFAVHCDETGAAVDTNREFIASVTTQEAGQWAQQVVKSGKTSGYLGGYRYLNRTTMDGSVVVFLNAEREIQSVRITMLVSGVVALVCLLLIFALVTLFSRRAIAPYVRNIETQKRFITDAGHELKTPLTAISASADVLAMDLPGNEWVTSIQNECVRMTRLVGDLVTLSRLDEEKPFPERGEFSLSDAVWEIAEPAASLAKARGKLYEQDIADGLTLCGDRAAIQQMVSILLDNALKYSGAGGVVRLTLGREKKRSVITVFNTCDVSKIPDVSRLFDRFYRPDDSRAHHTGGTGIGLSIAKATAERHGGRISARTGDGGITFTVRL